MDIQSVALQISSVLKHIPWSAWEQVVGLEPEFREMQSLSRRYSGGAFLTLMVIAGLNDYQLKGKSEEAYWPQLRKCLEDAPVPESPSALCTILEPFYRRERLATAKINRLKRFLQSSLVERLWGMESEDVTRQFQGIWREIAMTMGQAPQKKTIALSLKTLAIGLLWLGETTFDFRGIPVPVDSRLQRLTPFLGEDEIRTFWDSVLFELQKTEKRLTHVHLDSFLWQYAGKEDPRPFLSKLGVLDVGQIVNGFDQLASSSTQVSSG